MAMNNESQAHAIAPRESGRDAKVGTKRLPKASARSVWSNLNRLIVAGRNEIIALEAGARIVQDSERRTRLREQAQRRVVFRRDLAEAVTALGGVPATRASTAATFAAGVRRVHQLLMGPHEGDAYSACVRASEAAAGAYAKALTLELPADVMFGVERQYAEIEWDRHELRRLRWGAELTPLPNPGQHDPPERKNAGAPRRIDDERALGVWSNEGGGAAGPSDGPENAGPRHRPGPLS